MASKKQQAIGALRELVSDTQVKLMVLERQREQIDRDHRNAIETNEFERRELTAKLERITAILDLPD